jgi:hypothetical protein
MSNDHMLFGFLFLWIISFFYVKYKFCSPHKLWSFESEPTSEPKSELTSEPKSEPWTCGTLLISKYLLQWGKQMKKFTLFQLVLGLFQKSGYNVLIFI